MSLRRFLPVAILIAFFTGFAMYGLFLAVGVAEVESEVFKSLVDANAALLGFLGVITVFILNTYRDATRVTEDKIYKLKLEHEKGTRSTPSVAYPGRTSNYSAVEKKYEEFKAKLQELEDRINDQREGSNESLSFTILSVFSFVVSILLCLLSMGNLSPQVRFNVTYLAIAATSFGLFYMFAMIWNLRVRLG